MTSIETSIVIAAPIDCVWSVLTALDRYADWNPYLVRIEGNAVAGTTITVHSVTVPGGDLIVAPVSVVSVEPYVMRWEGGLPDRGQFKGDHWFVLNEEKGNTRFDHFEHFSGALEAAILAAHGETIRTNFLRFNDALKAHTESIT